MFTHQSVIFIICDGHFFNKEYAIGLYITNYLK